VIRITQRLPFGFGRVRDRCTRPDSTRGHLHDLPK